MKLNVIFNNEFQARAFVKYFVKFDSTVFVDFSDRLKVCIQPSMPDATAAARYFLQSAQAFQAGMEAATRLPLEMSTLTHALCWFANEYHSGQGSRGYRLLNRAIRRANRQNCLRPLDLKMDADAEKVYHELVSGYGNKI